MKTKIIGYALILVAILKVVIDAFDGGTFDLYTHLDEFQVALGGAGLVFLRSGVEKVKDAITK